MTPRCAFPEPLPTGEHVLWHGTPAFRPLARAFHLRLLAGYFAALLVWYVARHAGQPGFAAGLLRTAALSAVALGLVAGYAALVCRTTAYTLTDRRVVLRTGIALPVTYNLPHAAIDSADLRRHADGSGDIVLTMAPGARLSTVALWPSVRPGRRGQPRPALLALPGIAPLAGLFGTVMSGEA